MHLLRKITAAFLVLLLVIGNGFMAKPAFADTGLATVIAVNKEIQGTTQNGDRLYAFTIPNDGNVTLSMLRNTSESWEVELTNEDGSSLEDFHTSHGSTVSGYEERQVGLKKGTYYVNVSRNTYIANSFKFQVKYTASTGYEKEYNGTIQAASPIQVNTLYKGAINKSNDQDYFVFTTPADGKITLSMKRNINSSWNMNLTSIDGSLEFESFRTSFGATATGLAESEVGLPKGTYIIAIDEYHNAENQIYEFQVKFTAGSQYEKEGNDTLETANPIAVNKPYYGHLQYSNEVDFYSFTLPSDGNINLLMKRNSNSSWYMTLYAKDGTEYKEFRTEYGSTVTGNEVREIGLPKGQYVVKITEYTNAGDVPYVFQVKYSAGNYYEKEYNDSLAEANPIVLNATYKGNLQNYNDYDSYSFSLSKKQQVRIAIPMNTNSSWNVNIHDENGNSISAFRTGYGSTVTGNDERTVTLDSGKYYIRISDYTNSPNVPYEFALWTATPMLTPEQVTVTNNTVKADVVTVAGLASGDTVKVYNAASKGTLLASVKASSTGVVQKAINQIGQKAGKIYVTVTKSGWTESLRTAVEFNGEQSNPLAASQVSVENNAGKPDVMTIKSLGTNDVVKVYNPAGKLIGQSMPAEAGQAAVAFVQIGQTSGTAYVSVIRNGMTESTKTAIGFINETIKTINIQLNSKAFSKGYFLNNAAFVNWNALKTLKIPYTYKGNGLFTIEGRTVKGESIDGDWYIKWSHLSPQKISYKTISGGYNFIYTTPVNVQLNGKTFSNGGYLRNNTTYVNWNALKTLKIPYTYNGNGNFIIEGRAVKGESINGDWYIQWKLLSPGKITYKAISGGYNFIYKP